MILSDPGSKRQFTAASESSASSLSSTSASTLSAVRREANILRWVLFALILAAMAARVSKINEPFTRNHESTCSGPMVCAARNMVRYGPLTVGFSSVLNTDQVPASEFVYYNHHPPLTVISMAVVAKVFGDEPWCYRLPSALCSVLTTGLLFLMLSRKVGWRIGLVAGLLHAFCPFSWLFAGMPDVVGPHLVFFGLAAIECYSLWFDTGVRRWIVLAAVAWFLAAMCDWPAYYIPPILAAHFVIRRPIRRWWRVIPFAVGAAAVLAVTVTWLMWSGDSTMISQLTHRMGGTSDSGVPVTFELWWWAGIRVYMMTTVTLPILLLVVVYFISLVEKLSNQKWAAVESHDTLIMLFLWGVAHVLIGMESSYQHMWVWVVMVPGLCAAAAAGANLLRNYVSQRVRLHPAMPYVLMSLAAALMIWSYLIAQQLSEEGFRPESPGYTIRDLGIAIRNGVPSGQGVLTSDLSDPATGYSQPALWFYADRQIRNGIRSVAQLDAALGDGDYNLYEGYTQFGGPAPKWFVLPTSHHEQFPELGAALDRRYAHWLKDGFILYYFDLSPEASSASARARLSLSFP